MRRFGAGLGCSLEFGLPYALSPKNGVENPTPILNPKSQSLRVISICFSFVHTPWAMHYIMLDYTTPYKGWNIHAL